MRRFVLGAFVIAAAATGAARQGAVKDSSSPAPTFNKDVLPILQKNCQSCHRPGQIGPMSLLTYQEARPWAQAISRQVIARAMPPWFADPKQGTFLNNRSLRQSDIDTIATWVDRGAPEGDPEQAPPPVKWPEHGWLIEPEVVVSLPDYPVPESGIIEWENLAIPGPFKDDTWLTSLEVLSSEPSVVHHMCVAFKEHNPETAYNRYEWMEVLRDQQGVGIRPRGARPSQGRPQERSGEGWVLTREVGSTEVKRRFGRPTISTAGTFCAVPGQTLRDFRQYDAATLIPGGYDIVVNIHHNPNGKAVVDRTKIGLTTTKQPPKKKFVEFNASGATSDFAIPPNDANYLAPKIDVTFQREAELVWMLPHMHMRGKDVTYTVIHPSGLREVVLHVPHYDNSKANHHNPNPNVWVYEGQQPWEEMFAGLFAVTVDRGVDDTQLTRSFLRSQ